MAGPAWGTKQPASWNSPWCLRVWEGGRCSLPVQRKEGGKRDKKTETWVHCLQHFKTSKTWVTPHRLLSRRAALSAILCPNVALQQSGAPPWMRGTIYNPSVQIFTQRSLLPLAKTRESIRGTLVSNAIYSYGHAEGGSGRLGQSGREQAGEGGRPIREKWKTVGRAWMKGQRLPAVGFKGEKRWRCRGGFTAEKKKTSEWCVISAHRKLAHMHRCVVGYIQY